MPHRPLFAAAVAAAGVVAAVATLGAGCAGRGGETAGPPTRIATDFNPAQIRASALFVRVALEGAWTERDKTTLTHDYEGLLLEGFNARAVLVKDVESGGAKSLDRGAALTRARAIGADHAILVDARAAREMVTVCQETGRQRRGQALVWRQNVEVLRASDGAARVQMTDSPALTATDAEVDCQTGRARRQDTSDVIRAAVEKLLSRLLGP
ncbi:MAG: hypothetical protein ACRELS_07635 [Candidatus Rokuibacteriota bacterium]